MSSIFLKHENEKKKIKFLSRNRFYHIIPCFRRKFYSARKMLVIHIFLRRLRCRKYMETRLETQADMRAVRNDAIYLESMISNAICRTLDTELRNHNRNFASMRRTANFMNLRTISIRNKAIVICAQSRMVFEIKKY